MPEEVLEEFTRQHIQSQRFSEVTFSWQGGEPTLMGLEFFEKAIAYQQKYRRSGQVIHNSLQTNGTNLNKDWGEFFYRHQFLIGISLNGPGRFHDTYRQDKGGKPTHERVMAGLEILKQYKVEFNILTCVHAANAHDPLEVYRFLRDEAQAKFIQFIPIVERRDNNRVTPRSVTGLQYGQFLIAVFDEWIRRDVGRVFVQIFDASLAAWCGERSGLCVMDETCGLNLALEHNGDLYSCDHFVLPRYFLGNIMEHPLTELVASDPQQKFGNAKLDSLPRLCRQCSVRFACNGGCPKDRFSMSKNGEPGLNYLCAGYKTFFTHIDQPMKLMHMLLRLGRDPDEVMNMDFA